MSILMIFLFIHQIVSAYGQSTNSVKIRRSDISGKQEDRFDLRKPFERCKNECNHFNANLSPEASKRGRCFCSCSREMAATFGIKNGSWQCIGNKEIRERELDACKRIHYFDYEKETHPLRMYEVRQSAALNISPDIQCSEKAARFSYQACNSGWKPLDNAASAWGLQVTKQISNSVENYTLKIANANQSKDLEGKVIKLAIPCGSEKPFCWLFKVAGFMTCPLKLILPTSIPSKPKTTTTTTTSSTATTRTTSRRTKAVFSVAPKHTALTATKVPITTISIGKATNPWPTDGDIETVNEASHDVSIPFIAGTAGSTVIVLLIALFIGLLVRRKRKRRHTRKSSTSLELNATKTDDTIDQYALVEENAPYQSLSPSPDGAMERGVYVSRYKVPETISESPKDCDEYDYAESSLVVRNNVLKISSPVHVSKEKVPDTPEDNGPHYYVLEGEDKDPQNEEPSEGDCERPDEGAPYYRVLEGPNPLDPPENFHKRDNKGAQDVPKELDNSYHTLEESSDNQDDCGGYKDLQSDGRVSIGYQALHKYSYVTCRDSGEICYK